MGKTIAFCWNCNYTHTYTSGSFSCLYADLFIQIPNILRACFHPARSFFVLSRQFAHSHLCTLEQMMWILSKMLSKWHVPKLFICTRNEKPIGNKHRLYECVYKTQNAFTLWLSMPKLAGKKTEQIWKYFSFGWPINCIICHTAQHSIAQYNANGVVVHVQQWSSLWGQATKFKWFPYKYDRCSCLPVDAMAVLYIFLHTAWKYKKGMNTVCASTKWLRGNLLFSNAIETINVAILIGFVSHSRKHKPIRPKLMFIKPHWPLFSLKMCNMSNVILLELLFVVVIALWLVIACAS